MKHTLGELQVAKLELKGIRMDIAHTHELKNFQILKDSLELNNLKFKESNAVLDDEFIDDKLKEYKDKQDRIIELIEPEPKRRYSHHKSRHKVGDNGRKEKEEETSNSEYEAETEWHKQSLEEEKKEVTPVFFSQIVVKE